MREQRNDNERVGIQSGLCVKVTVCAPQLTLLYSLHCSQFPFWPSLLPSVVAQPMNTPNSYLHLRHRKNDGATSCQHGWELSGERWIRHPQVSQRAVQLRCELLSRKLRGGAHFVYCFVFGRGGGT